jgi:hypothetical protein
MLCPSRCPSRRLIRVGRVGDIEVARRGPARTLTGSDALSMPFCRPRAGRPTPGTAVHRTMHRTSTQRRPIVTRQAFDLDGPTRYRACFAVAGSACLTGHVLSGALTLRGAVGSKVGRLGRLAVFIAPAAEAGVSEATLQTANRLRPDVAMAADFCTALTKANTPSGPLRTHTVDAYGLCAPSTTRDLRRAICSRPSKTIYQSTLAADRSADTACRVELQAACRPCQRESGNPATQFVAAFRRRVPSPRSVAAFRRPPRPAANQDTRRTGFLSSGFGAGFAARLRCIRD